jgi:hypothetical protein
LLRAENEHILNGYPDRDQRALVIERFEDANELPDGIYSIGDFYAIRSVERVHSAATFNAGPMAFSFGWEFLSKGSGPKEWLSSVPFFLFSPFLYIYDMGSYPKKLVTTLKIPKQEIELALKDLQVARMNGYRSETFNFHIIEFHTKHLDVLGYKQQKKQPNHEMKADEK